MYAAYSFTRTALLLPELIILEVKQPTLRSQTSLGFPLSGLL